MELQTSSDSRREPSAMPLPCCNALMETITYGKRAGAHGADWALSNTTVEVPESTETAQTVHENVGVFGRETRCSGRARSSLACGSVTRASSSRTRARSSGPLPGGAGRLQ